MAESKPSKEEIGWLDEKQRWKLAVVSVTQNIFRKSVGVVTAHKCGHWLDHHLCRIIHCFSDWIEYPIANAVLKGHKHEVNSLAVSDDGYYVYSGCRDGSIRVWSLMKHESCAHWTAHSGVVRCLVSNQRWLISGGYDQIIKVWDRHFGYPKHSEFRNHNGIIFSLDINDNGTILVSGSSDYTIKLWCLSKMMHLKSLRIHEEWVNTVCFLNDSAVISASDDCCKVIMDIHSQLSLDNNDDDSSDIPDLKSINEGINSEICNVIVNCDGSRIACLFSEGFNVYQWPSLELSLTIAMPVYRGCFHTHKPDLIAVDHDLDFSIGLWDLSQIAEQKEHEDEESSDPSEPVVVFKGHSNLINCIRFTPDGHRMVSVSRDKTVRVWDLTYYLDSL